MTLLLDIFIFPAFKLRFIEIGRAERWNFHSKTVKGFYDGCSPRCRVLVKVEIDGYAASFSPRVYWCDKTDWTWFICVDVLTESGVRERERERQVMWWPREGCLPVIINPIQAEEIRCRSDFWLLTHVSLCSSRQFSLNLFVRGYLFERKIEARG